MSFFKRKNNRLPFLAGIRYVCDELDGNANANIFKKRRAADHNFFFLNNRPHAFAFYCFKFLGVFKHKSLFFCLGNDCPSDWMFRERVKRSRQLQSFFFRMTVCIPYVYNSKLPFGQCARLIKEHHINRPRDFQREPLLYDKAVLRRLRGGNRSNKWHSEPKRMRTSNNEHSNETRHCKANIRTSNKPCDERYGTASDRNNGQIKSCSVRENLKPRL